MARKWSSKLQIRVEIWAKTSLILAYVYLLLFLSSSLIEYLLILNQIPGGGVGLNNGCTVEWGAPSSGWGAQYGGISSRSDCDNFPKSLQAGCYWRFDWFMGADNPSISFTQIECPAAITANTGCVRAINRNALETLSVNGSLKYSSIA
jgi:hypothetical protein